MIEPPAARRIDASTAFMPRNTLVWLTAITRSYSSIVISWSNFRKTIPALFTRTLIGPNAASVAVTLIISARLTPIYESTATVDIDRQTPSGVVGQEASRGATNDADQFLATQIRLFVLAPSPSTPRIGGLRKHWSRRVVRSKRSPEWYRPPDEAPLLVF